MPVTTVQHPVTTKGQPKQSEGFSLLRTGSKKQQYIIRGLLCLQRPIILRYALIKTQASIIPT
jgi:hypothetical protein